MQPTPASLVFLLDATVNDDAGSMRYLIRRFPLMAKRAVDLTDDERKSISNSDHPNHFYTCKRSDGTRYGGLIIEDSPQLRELVHECDLDSLIDWGNSRANHTNPVEFATIADIVDNINTSPNVLSFMEEIKSKQSWSTFLGKRPRPYCFRGQRRCSKDAE